MLADAIEEKVPSGAPPGAQQERGAWSVYMGVALIG